MIDRRSFMQAAAAALAAPTAFAQADVVNVMTPFGFIADFLEMMNAVSGGHFKRAGLNAKLIGGTGTSSALQQLSAGQVKFVRNASIDLIKSGTTQALPLIAIATIYQTGHWYLMSAKDKPLPGAEALRGKTIGVVSVKGTTENYLDLILAKVGIKPQEVKREVVGNNPGAFQMIQQGRIDGFIASVAVYASLKVANAPMVAFNCDRYASLPSQCYITSREVLQKEPDTALRFLRAMKASCEEMLAGDFFAVLERAMKDFDIPGTKQRDQLVLVWEQAKESWLANGRQNLLRNNPEQWSGAAQALTQAGLADVKNVQQFYTNELVDKLK